MEKESAQTRIINYTNERLVEMQKKSEIEEEDA